jgi:DNA-binding transcriptional LysR family regulator
VVASSPVWVSLSFPPLLSAMKSHRVRVLLGAFEPKPLPLHAVYSSRRFLPFKVRAMIEFLAHELPLDPRVTAFAM